MLSFLESCRAGAGVERATLDLGFLRRSLEVRSGVGM